MKGVRNPEDAVRAGQKGVTCVNESNSLDDGAVRKGATSLNHHARKI